MRVHTLFVRVLTYEQFAKLKKQPILISHSEVSTDKRSGSDLNV